ncbi:MAG: hypothetical protein ACKOE5_04300 [Cytophagales bacterium]
MLGLLTFASGVNALSDTQSSGNGLIAGAVIIFVTLAYYLAKRRKLGKSSVVALAIEVGFVAIALFLAFFRSDLRSEIVADPVPVVIIPLIAFLIYGFGAAAAYRRQRSLP